MAAKAEQSEIVKRALAMLHGNMIPDQASQAETGGQEQTKPTAELLAISVLAEHEPDEVSCILAVWRDLFGMQLDRRRVETHLKELRKWQNRWLRSG